MEPIRLNKYLSQVGYCSRREADRLIEEGAVTVDGVLAELGTRVTDDNHILVRGEPLKKEEEPILLVFNKPRGIVCTTAHFDKDNVIDYLQYPKRIYPVGRLDKNSEGLLLLTNQGELVNKLLRAGNRHEKEYVVTVDRLLDEPFLKAMASGVYLEELDVTTRPCEVRQTGIRTFHITLTQGYNRQIRRMCETLGYRVRRLRRIRIMNIRLGDLPVGEYRDATGQEIKILWESIKDSSNTTVIDPDWKEKRKHGAKKETNQRADRSAQ